MGGRSPILPWFFADSDSLTCRALELARADLGHRVYLLARSGVTPRVAECLRDVGIRDRVALVGTVRSRTYGDVSVIARVPSTP